MLPQVQKILQASRVDEFFWKWPLDDVKNHNFDVKCQKLLKNKFFVLFSIFLKPSSQIFDLFGGPGIYCNLPFYQSLYNNSLLVTPNIAYL